MPVIGLMAMAITMVVSCNLSDSLSFSASHSLVPSAVNGLMTMAMEMAAGYWGSYPMMASVTLIASSTTRHPAVKPDR